ncbi:hypothetical protein FQR65_LT15026 [Abscondita terminalis]|nr:hypothetical protein FQR65_LT15026 [Abscondita terminalis]
MENLDIGLLIDLVNGYEYLYDKGHKSYKDLIIKENAWLEIALTLNSTPDTCKKAFLSLKEKYTRERKKIKNTPSGSGVITKWVWYDLLSFLDAHIQQRRITTTNFYRNKEVGCSGSSETTLESDDADASTISSDNQSDDTLTEIQNEEEIVTPSSNTPQHVLPSRRKNRKIQSQEVDEKILETLSSLGNKTCEEAEFGQLVAVELSRIDKDKRKTIKKKIMELVYF